MSRAWLSFGSEAGLVLLASCLGDDTGGGVFAYDGETLECLDRVSTTGLCLAEGQLIRALWCSSEVDATSEFLIYDRLGVKKYFRLDGLADLHDVLWDGHSFVAVSSASNSVVWITTDGEIANRWIAPGNGDAWHLNSLLLKDGDLLVSAFGRFEQHRAWSGDAKLSAGIVVNLTTGKDVLGGLTCPHHPRFVDGSWIICNSGSREILQIDPRTQVVSRRVRLNGWTRGLAIGDEHLFVGESAHRNDTGAGQTARIAVVSRQTWEVVDRIALPCREVYDLIAVDPLLVDGVRRGFRTNRQRFIEADQLALFDNIGVQPIRLWATGDPLPPEACRITIEPKVPITLAIASVVDVECRLENRGGAFLVSAPPNPVRLSYKWLEPGSRLPIGVRGAEGLRTTLPRTLLPYDSITCTMQIATPPEKGEYLLRVTLVQEFVAWFDDLDDTNCWSGIVEVIDPQVASETTDAATGACAQSSADGVVVPLPGLEPGRTV